MLHDIFSFEHLNYNEIIMTNYRHQPWFVLYCASPL